MNGDDKVGRMPANQRARRLTGNGPHGGRDEARLCAPIGGVETGAPKLRSFYHVRIHGAHAVKRRRGVILEEIHHFGGHLIFVFKLDGFDDGFSCGAMPAAGIGEVENNMRFSRSRLCVHVVLLYVG